MTVGPQWGMAAGWSLLLAASLACAGGHFEYVDPEMQTSMGRYLAARERDDELNMLERGGIIRWVEDPPETEGAIVPPPKAEGRSAETRPEQRPEGPGSGPAGAGGRQSPAPASAPMTSGPAPSVAEVDLARGMPAAASAPVAEGAAMDARAAERFEQGMVRLRSGDFSGADIAFQDLAARFPRDPVLRTARAEALNRLGRHEEAEAEAAEAVRLDPASSRALEQLGYASVRLLRLPEALSASERALKLDPKNAEAFFVRYLAAGRAGDFAGALAALREAARLRPEAYGKLLKRVERAGSFIDPRDRSTLAGEADLPDEGGSGGRRRSWWPLLSALILPALFALRRKRRSSASGIRKLAPVSTTGRRVGKYELKTLLGRGGMGDVFEAVDTTLGRTVAIKLVSDRLAELELQSREMLLAEARTVAALHHPAIVDIYDVIESGKDLYLVFEHVKGRTLAHALAESGHLGVERACALLKPVCEALAFAHGRGLVHRDLKPANIMVTDDGGVKLMDFGVARALGTRLTPPKLGDQKALAPFARTTTVAGTPHYMAPETETGIVSPAGDVYALGVTLYELLTGRLPFTYPEQKRSMDFKPASQWVPGLPPEADALIRAALEPDATKRIQAARQFQERLEIIVSRRSSAS